MHVTCVGKYRSKLAPFPFQNETSPSFVCSSKPIQRVRGVGRLDWAYIGLGKCIDDTGVFGRADLNENLDSFDGSSYSLGYALQMVQGVGRLDS
jgi:hypothetical protein